jgi:hypothetical protein
VSRAEIESSGATAPAQAVEALPDRERRNPFYRWLMHLGIPVSVSLTLHAVLLSLLALRTFQFLVQPQIDVGDYNASLTDSLADRMNQAFQWTNPDELQTPPDQAEKPLDITDFSELRDLDTSSLTEKDTGPAEGLGVGEGRLSLLGTGGGAGGFGAGMGGEGRRIGQAGIWDFTIQANKIVYVVDFSGSIVVAVDDLKKELKRSVGSLKPFQSFDVVIFYSNVQQEKAIAEAFAGSLQIANEEVRKKFFEWIDKKAPVGGTDPLPAMKRALAMRPEAIFLFSDGEFDENYVTEIKSANRAAARVYCLVFDELLLGGAKRLKRVAEQNGGKVKVVTGADLRKR